MLLLLVIMSISTSCMAADIQVSIDEEVPLDTEVARLTDFRSVYSNASAGQNFPMTYDLLNRNNPPANYFRVDPNTGVVQVARRLDREAICDPTDRCSVKFNIAVHAGAGTTNVISLEVVINDINDNPPMFPARDVTLDIPEGAKVGTELKISGPSDRDSKPEFTVQHYLIIPALNVFSLTPNVNLDGTISITLRLERELDREAVELYRFQIVAMDGGPNPQNDSLSVTVRVTDDNDNYPQFNQSRYQMTINENEALGTLVGQVTATDKDAGDFGRVTYSLSSSSVKNVFAINSTTGVITLIGDARALRRNSPSTCLLYAEARDGGDPPLTAQACVSVLVINSGNNPPSVTVNTVVEGDVSALNIPESAFVDHFVAFVDVEDNDDGDNGRVACQILSSPDFKLSPVQNKGYTLLLNTSVDREKKDSYKILINCQDAGTPPLELKMPKELIVNITDVNDNTPMFTRNLYMASVDENRDPGQFVTQAQAHDADVGVNAEITYSVPTEAHEYIKIDPKTGIISTNIPFDRELNSTLRFKLFATDGGVPPRTGVAEVSISVKDLNDNSPKFSKPSFSFQISEQAPNNTLVGALSAYDLDIGLNSQFDFYFGGSTFGDASFPFNVLANGSLLVSGSLDRETKALYSFSTIVRDRGVPPRSSTAAVEIKVLDENDNDPVILFPTSNNHTVVISSPPENGMILGRIIAYDVDEDDSPGLRYFIYDGNEEGVFTIGLKTGEVVLQSVDRLHNPQEYLLSIKVEDATPRSRNATTQLRVDVRFENLTDLNTYNHNVSPRDHYVIIVGVIGGATVVLSIIIISAIFFILHSDKNRRAAKNGTYFKNNFCNGRPVQPVVAANKPVDGLDSSQKSQSSSSLASDPHGMIISPANLPRKQEDTHKKVSFSLQDEFHDQGQVLLPDKPMGFHLPAGVDSLWKKFNNPDDINSDASGESGTCDSGRGTSEEDIKFDHSPGRGLFRPRDQSGTSSDRSFDQAFPHLPNTSGRQALHFQRPSGPNSQHPKSTRPRAADAAYGNNNQGRSTPLPNDYHGQRQAPFSTFAPGVPCLSKQSSFNSFGGLSEKQAQPSFAHPVSGVSFPSNVSVMSMTDDAASTTTSGSYVINHDDVMLDGYLCKDVVV